VFLAVGCPLHQEPSLNDGENGPKRRQTRRLGLGFFFFLFRVFCILINGFIFYLGSIYVLTGRRGFGWAARKKRAQTTPDVLFGPIGTCFFVRVFCWFILPRILWNTRASNHMRVPCFLFLFHCTPGTCVRVFLGFFIFIFILFELRRQHPLPIWGFLYFIY
jgi:hypothetical protein